MNEDDVDRDAPRRMWPLWPIAYAVRQRADAMAGEIQS